MTDVNLTPEPPMQIPAGSDFFQSYEGSAWPIPSSRRGRVRLWARDLVCDLRLWLGAGLRSVRKDHAATVARILIVGIEVPSRAADIHDTVARLKHKSRHDVTVSITPMLNRGKFANLEAAIASAPRPLAAFDWMVMTDDDILFPPRLLDDMIAIASAADLALSQPSHAWLSHASYKITQRRFGVLARRTNFVEIGPLTLVRADLFDALVPFPPSRWCYGIDLLWSSLARRVERRIGVIDGTPVRHMRPVAAGYNIDAALAEGQQLILAHGVNDSRMEFLEPSETVLTA